MRNVVQFGRVAGGCTLSCAAYALTICAIATRLAGSSAYLFLAASYAAIAPS